MADLFLVAMSGRPQDQTERDLMEYLMRQHANRAYSAGHAYLSNQNPIVDSYAFFISEFLTQCHQGNLMAMARDCFGVEPEEYMRRLRRWSEADDSMRLRNMEVIKFRREHEKKRGHQSIWPRLAWIFGRQRLTEVADDGYSSFEDFD